MTEQEALKFIKDANRTNHMVGILPGSDIGKCIINALEEIHQYRKIGTPEECRAAVKRSSDEVCEWKNAGTNDNWKPSCEPNATFNVFGLAWFNRCPYCGKKIEVVE